MKQTTGRFIRKAYRYAIIFAIATIFVPLVAPGDLSCKIELFMDVAEMSALIIAAATLNIIVYNQLISNGKTRTALMNKILAVVILAGAVVHYLLLALCGCCTS